MTVAGKFQAPNTPTLIELNAEALAGSMDAARRLASVSVKCKKVEDFITKFVPIDEALCVVGLQRDGAPYYVFDLYCDAYVWSRTPGAKRDTLELPAV